MFSSVCLKLPADNVTNTSDCCAVANKIFQEWSRQIHVLYLSSDDFNQILSNVKTARKLILVCIVSYFMLSFIGFAFHKK